MKYIDVFLNNTTMYRVVLYYLAGLWLIALGLSFMHLLPFTPLALIVSLLAFCIICICTNAIFAAVFGAPSNTESAYITAFILALIISPGKPFTDISFFFWAGVLAIASKYIFAIQKKHIFNPAAVAIAATALILNQSATWWIGTSLMAPFVLAGGLLIARKIQRFDLVFSFFVVSFATITWLALFNGQPLFTTLGRLMLNSPWLFFAFVMLTEPMTTPHKKFWRIVYGGLVGFLFAPQLHIGSLYSTPELALLAGNLFSYVVSPKSKYILTLTQKIQLTPDTYDFIFLSDKKVHFQSGQYMEFTLPHAKKDSRGMRRFFTIASSPTEHEIRLGVKFYAKTSSFKKALLALPPGGELIASQLGGDFVMPWSKKTPLVFIAGGIGITPFRSMIQYLIDKNQKRPITLFYSTRTSKDVAYKNIFDMAQKRLDIQTIYAYNDTQGPMNAELIKTYVPNCQDCVFYLSGPRAMVVHFKTMLKQMGVRSQQIKSDFFPGFA